MGTASGKKRFDLRLDPEVRMTIERAASLTGLQITSFVLNAAVEKARQIIQDEQLVILDRNATVRFREMMDAEYQPKGKMATFLGRYRRAMPKLPR